MRRLAISFAFAGILAFASGVAPAAAASEFGFEPGSVEVSESTMAAGGHPDLTTSFVMNSEESGEAVAATSRIEIALPPGLTGNPNVVGSCTLLQLTTTDVESPTNESSCPVDSQVGITEVTLFNQGGTQSLLEPIYNMAPPADGSSVARLGFYAKFFPTLIDIRLRSQSDYGLTASLEGAGSLIPLLAANTTIWGVPASEAHDPLRITPYEALHCGATPCTAPGEEPRSSGLAPAPFLSNPTECSQPQRFGFTAFSYVNASRSVAETIQLPAPTGCAKLEFSPSFSATPTSAEAAAPTGLDADLSIPQNETVDGRATSQLRDARVVLPRGMTVAPGAADGLATCDEQQAGYRASGPAHCPEAAKIGSAEIDVPALSRHIEGAVYQRTPAPGRLFRIWLVADELGVHLALPGEVELDPVSGQITSVFLDTPPAPVRELKLHLKSGARAPLANPPACGGYLTSFEFVPRSGAGPTSGSAPMSIGQACGTGGFAPSLSAGTTRSAAGRFAPFVMDLSRRDGEQNLSSLDVEMPRGLLAKLAGVPLCQASPAASGACPEASRVGEVSVATGPGPLPLWVPQPGKAPTAVYLAGPYRSAPYSLVVRVPAQAGPFDLGTVVTRAAIDVDPRTAQAIVRSDPLPQILEGVPVTYRHVVVRVDRPSFTFNPTNCEPMSVVAMLSSIGGTHAQASDRFQAAGCRGLGFRPHLSLGLRGGSRRGAFPSLRTVFRPRWGDANLRTLVLRLPHSEFIEQAHFRTICTRVQYAAGACPAGSVYGQVTVRTPILDRPLSGPVYLRSSTHELPDAVLALHGQVDVEVPIHIDSIKGGLRAVVSNAPDVPVDKVVVNMRGGQKGLFVNSTNICLQGHRARIGMRGQNGARKDFDPLLQIACGEHRKRHPARHGGKGRLSSSGGREAAG
jgi:hypothetical protein